ncbi:nucleotide pyrophosphohydrolase [Flavobacterium sp.]|jgi:hypothetical protein|uniref:nucleotide pyrophosphohydrolase n=1 Tax=Flavobacterium sp. TaxID=239 RepID=UPI0037C12272
MKTKYFFDSDFNELEQLPRNFIVNFESLKVDSKFKTKVSIDGIQVGDIIDDNSKEIDSYRFHDVFHYTFATMLCWSPCTRAMMKRKRKSLPEIDEIEDGARATITEEAISLMIFNNAKQKDFFKNQTKVSISLLNQIKCLTSSFEVSERSKKEWKYAILKGYSLFNELVNNNGGRIHFNMIERTAVYEN